MKAADLEPLHRERLHDTNAADRLLEHRRHVGHALLRAMRRFSQSESEVNDGIDQQRRRNECDQRQLGIRDEDVDEKADQRDRFLKQIAHARGHRRLDLIGIRHEPADHLAGRAFREESMALVDDFFVQLIAQIAHRR